MNSNWYEHQSRVLVVEKKRAHLIYSGLAFYDLHPLSWPTKSRIWINPLKTIKWKENSFTWTLQGEQIQAQSITNPKSSKLLYNELEIKEKYVMIT